jgi:phospholipid-binding lipoprotein MlaA
MLALLATVVLAGCAELSDQHAASTSIGGDVGARRPTDVSLVSASSDLIGFGNLVAVSAAEDVSGPAIAPGLHPEKNVPSDAAPPAKQDEFIDPFARPGESAGAIEEYDPWEGFNVRMFNFNRQVDKYLLKPVAKAYDRIMPDELERGISRGFYNLGVVHRTVNSLLQGKFKRAGVEITRFLLNSTFGIAGMLDFAKEVFNIETSPEDSGQTLGFLGLGPGPYLQLPFLQPLTIRDGVGYLLDVAMNPMNWILPFTTLFPMNVGNILNERSINLETFQGVEEATIDLYGAVRNAYLQKRAQAIRE